MLQLDSKNYVRLLEECSFAWSARDVEAVCSFYAEDLDYRDPNVINGINTMENFRRYLRVLFRKWPEQSWAGKLVMPMAQLGCFTVTYDFSLRRGEKVVRGCGLDRIEFKGEKIRICHVYLNAYNWSEWIKTV